MIFNLTRSSHRNGRVKIYGVVQRNANADAHRVVYIRSKSFRGWLCDCSDFFFSAFAKHQNCDHLKAAREKYGRFGAKLA